RRDGRYYVPPMECSHYEMVCPSAMLVWILFLDAPTYPTTPFKLSAAGRQRLCSDARLQRPRGYSAHNHSPWSPTSSGTVTRKGSNQAPGGSITNSDSARVIPG